MASYLETSPDVRFWREADLIGSLALTSNGPRAETATMRSLMAPGSSLSEGRYEADHKYEMKTPLTSAQHRIVAYVEVDSHGRHTISDRHHRLLGFFDPKTNRTTDRHHRTVGYGYLLPRLIPEDLGEDGLGTIKPKSPLTPAQARREAERKSRVQSRINDTSNDFAKKMRDLRAKL